MDAFRPGLKNLTPDRLKMRSRTGLDVAVRPAEIEFGPADRARRLMAESSDDSDVAAVTRIARGLMAAVAVPRPVVQPDDRPAGGVADISNRGPLDRLLLSELADDDLTLAVRVAVNEALYMQRETPPRHPPRDRAIFVDTGLRVWGVPRIFAAGVALAITASTDSDGDVAAFRAGRGPFLIRADLTSRDGLIDHLSALDDRAHFGETLVAFAEYIDGRGDTTEPFSVSHPDVLNDPDLQRFLRQHGPQSAHAAAVDRDGSFTLWHLSPAGRRLVRKACLDLEALLEPSAEKNTVARRIVETENHRLPVILSMRPFPLRLPPTSAIRATITSSSEKRAFAISSDRRLVGSRVPTFGPLQLVDAVPSGRVDLLAFYARSTVVAVITHVDSNTQMIRCSRVVADVDGNGFRVDDLSVDFAPAGIAFDKGFIYFIGRDGALVFDLKSTTAVAKTGSDRFYDFRYGDRIHYSGQGQCSRLAFDGV